MSTTEDAPTVARYACGRLSVMRQGPSAWRFVDRLRPGARVLQGATFEHVRNASRDAEMFRLGFLDATLPPARRPLADAPRDRQDAHFWQFPCKTEAVADAAHGALPAAVSSGNTLHTYLGLPWATWIDRRRHCGDAGHSVRQELLMQRVRINGFHRALRELGIDLRVHTVCQHVYWREMLDTWRNIGVTDAWLSHAPSVPAAVQSQPAIHPWSLYAVNFEEPNRRIGLRVGTDPTQKPLLASFIGAHADHYMSRTRLLLQSLAATDGFHVEVTDRWHFEDIVYKHQVHGEAIPASLGSDAAVERYNRLLSDSVFSLCPAGAGPNTLRLWESLAVGSIPVLVGPMPRLPQGGTLPAIDWDRIVLRVSDESIKQLPNLLRGIPAEDVRRRQQLGLQAYELVRRQRCF